MFLPVNALFTSHVGQAGGRGLSPRLWTKVAGQALAPDGAAEGFVLYDDFLNFGDVAPGAGGATTGVMGGWGYYVDTTTSAASIRQLGTDPGGVVQLATPATADYEATLTSGGGRGVLGPIGGSNAKLTIFEVRFRTTTVTKNFFIGLTQAGVNATDGVITDAGALADIAAVGFFALEASPTTLAFGYRATGQAAQTPIASLATLAANTWYKVGFVFDPSEPSSSRLKVFLDNVQNATMLTADQIGAATFPAGVNLAATVNLKNATAAATLDVDWVAFYQGA